MRITEIETRLTAIKAELESEGADITALSAETDALIEERNNLLNTAEQRNALLDRIAKGAGIKLPDDKKEERAETFVRENKMSIGVAETRSILVSSGAIATPTEVSGINDVGAKYSSIIDLVKVVNCEGMGKNRVAYVSSDPTASTQTEGSSASTGEATFAYIDIAPTSVAVTTQISKQVKKQSPLLFEAKVREQSLNALKRKASEIVVSALKASTLTTTIAADLAGATGSKTGAITAGTLRNIVLAYGGNEGVGAGVLFLSKTDLIAFGDVRGTNEKRAIYEITPDSDNPNTGIIKDGGLSVRYCINSNLTACHGTAQSATVDIPTMFYGDPQCFELDLFSPYEVNVSTDYAITSLMDTIVGDVELGGDVVVQDGFVALTIVKA